MTTIPISTRYFDIPTGRELIPEKEAAKRLGISRVALQQRRLRRPHWDGTKCVGVQRNTTNSQFKVEIMYDIDQIEAIKQGL